MGNAAPNADFSDLLSNILLDKPNIVRATRHRRPSQAAAFSLLFSLASRAQVIVGLQECAYHVENPKEVAEETGEDRKLVRRCLGATLPGISLTVLR